MSSNREPTLVCDLTAIPTEARAAHAAASDALFGAVLEKQELEHGYAFRLPADSTVLAQAATFIANERLCCPFFRFQLDVQPGGMCWLTLTGPDGVKDLLGGLASDH
ncbi:MAG: hypothetical protein CL610_22400 [Anaerolineaceae bacterium]|nr:hypothetical protein [Anaerolineaceae bacterium]